MKRRILDVTFLLACALSPRISKAAELGISFGPFLPSRIGGVGEVMNGWAARLGIDATAGNFEIEYFNAHGSGDHYHTLALDYRLDLEKSSNFTFPIHFILGFHGDSYQASDSLGNALGSKTTGGWHYGGGLRYPLGGETSPLTLRADFKHRFSPGTSLIVLLGLNLELDSDVQKTP